MKKKNSELYFLSSLEEGKEVTQKNISNKISVSIGFVNALIKKFLKKGIIKVQEAPYKRFVYYLTPEGFSEKSKLVLNYLNDSLSLFRSMRKEFNQLFSENLSSQLKDFQSGLYLKFSRLNSPSLRISFDAPHSAVLI